MKTVLMGVFVFSIVAMEITPYFNLKNWHTSVGFVVLAVVLYFATTSMARYYLRQARPEGTDDDTADTVEDYGIIPQWVRTMGLLAISALIAAAAPWIVAFIKELY